VALAGVVFLAALACVAQAYAWSVQGSTSGVTLSASLDDTQTVTFTVYTDDKDGTNPSSAQYTAAYNSTTSAWAIDTPNGVQTVELPKASGVIQDGYNLVVVKRGSTVEEKHVIFVEPVEVKAAGTLPVSMAATMPVTLSGDTSVTVSADSTLPVQVAGIAGLSDLDFSLLLVVLGGVLGFAAYRGLGAVWSVHRD